MKLQTGYFDELDHTFIESELWLFSDGMGAAYLRVGMLEFSMMCCDYSTCKKRYRSFISIGTVTVSNNRINRNTILDLIFC